MAITASPRLGITRWSVDADTVSRAQFDGDHGRLDDLVALDMQGTLAARPAAAAANRGLYYMVADGTDAANDGRLYRSTGAAWVEIQNAALANAAYVAKADQVWQRIGEARLTAAGEFIFNAIPATFRHLQLVVVARSSLAAANDLLILRMNGDTTAVYDWSAVIGAAGAVSFAEVIGDTRIGMGRIPAANATADLFGAAVIDIPDYARGGRQKLALSRNHLKHANTAGSLDVRQHAGSWRGTVEVTQVQVTAGGSNLAAGSVASLYGMKGA
jgi:hypothetical protein